MFEDGINELDVLADSDVATMLGSYELQDSFHVEYEEENYAK